MTHIIQIIQLESLIVSIIAGTLGIVFTYIVSYDVTVFAHVFNVLNELYVQDATDNSRFNAYDDDGKNHKADDAEVFLGFPTHFNIGVSLGF